MKTHAVPDCSQAWPVAGVWRWQAQEAGELQLLAGQAWLTRDGDALDYVLSPGQSLCLCAGDWVTAEPWQAGQVAQLAWVGVKSAGPGVVRAGVVHEAGKARAEGRATLNFGLRRDITPGHDAGDDVAPVF
jgi:hypothetical protein